MYTSIKSLGYVGLTEFVYGIILTCWVGYIQYFLFYPRTIGWSMLLATGSRCFTCNLIVVNVADYIVI